MRVVCAFDSFKGGMSAPEACAAAARGVERLEPRPSVIHCPMADGGEGFAEALSIAGCGHTETVRVTGPLFTPVDAALVWLDGGKTAIVESAQACGLCLIPRDRRNPGAASTRGVGELLRRADQAGVERIIVGLGGSGTNDGGIGLLSAWGWRFLDGNGHELPPVGDSLSAIRTIVPGDRPVAPVFAACDVKNPLHGPSGAAHVYARQKGASDADIERLDAGLANYGRIASSLLGNDVTQCPGAGAAGGLGFALLAFFKATFRPGAEVVIDVSGLRRHLDGADLCLTGEGRTDAQTLNGKLPAAVMEACRDKGVPCVCLSGCLGTGWRDLYSTGCAGVAAICQKTQTLEEAIAESPECMADAAEMALRLFAAGMAHGRR